MAREPAARNGHAVFPAEQVSAAEYADGSIETDDPADLDMFALEAPPVGEPEGDRRTWHPPTLGLQCVEASTWEEYVAALRKLAWLYNWHLPVLPFAHARTQHFLDTVDFDWPDLAAPSRAGVGAGAVQPEDLVALGLVSRADDGTTPPTGTGMG